VVETKSGPRDPPLLRHEAVARAFIVKTLVALGSTVRPYGPVLGGLLAEDIDHAREPQTRPLRHMDDYEIAELLSGRRPCSATWVSGGDQVARKLAKASRRAITEYGTEQRQERQDEPDWIGDDLPVVGELKECRQLAEDEREGVDVDGSISRLEGGAMVVESGRWLAGRLRPPFHRRCHAISVLG
jgi:hypothetical protein